ncbi:glycine decarboxylase [Nitzschia inconspicua]|uniref:Glycine cleavage system H protein n=1 Tax=Nitzschia inconspicua TaxID=303405 RepID=A0A9K3LDJ2_9STRA|nr:glycine decarboxylase [Nitzschia inconspicua]
MSASIVARTFSRRVMTETSTLLRATRFAPQLGAIRLNSYYTPAHEYVKVEGNVGTCGITDFAQAALGDIVFVDLPEVGDQFEKGDAFGSVESVKAASDVYAPVSGTVVEINEALVDEPALVNNSAEDSAWFIKIEMSNKDEVNDLMGEADYKAHCESESA